MDSTIITVIITAAGTLLSTIISCITSLSLVNWRLQQLEKKVEEHNQWGAKFASQETDIALMKADIAYIKSDLSEIKEYIKSQK